MSVGTGFTRRPRDRHPYGLAAAAPLHGQVCRCARAESGSEEKGRSESAANPSSLPVGPRGLGADGPKLSSRVLGLAVSPSPSHVFQSISDVSELKH